MGAEVVDMEIGEWPLEIRPRASALALARLFDVLADRARTGRENLDNIAMRVAWEGAHASWRCDTWVNLLKEVGGFDETRVKFEVANVLDRAAGADPEREVLPSRVLCTAPGALGGVAQLFGDGPHLVLRIETCIGRTRIWLDDDGARVLGAMCTTWARDTRGGEVSGGKR